MKPREFDDLIKRKFDEGGFEYKAQNWDRLAEELDGKEKKRGLLVWWMPLIGVAASVALAMGVPIVLHEGGTLNNRAAAPYANVAATPAAEFQGTTNIVADVAPAPVQEIAKTEVKSETESLPVAEPLALLADNTAAVVEENTDNKVSPKTIIAAKSRTLTYNSSVVETFASNVDEMKKMKKEPKQAIGFYTFKERTPRVNTGKVNVSISGGLNYSAQANGYVLGATARRMINDRVYVESDIAFIGTNNTGKYSEMEYTESIGGVNSTASSRSVSTSSTPSTISSGTTASMHATNVAARSEVIQKNTVETVTTAPPPVVVTGHIKTVEKAYNLFYAQVTPSLGYKMKRMSIGVGPDFQQMLVDNRPATSATEVGNIREVPMFDIGFMGKTEYAVSKNIKAAIYYREGINNVITPMNKYIDRNYLQFQIKCAILNR